LLANTWIVVRIDGRAFTKYGTNVLVLISRPILICHRMCAKYRFEKPNDRRALDLMNAAAKAVVADLPDIIISYGISDEYR
jgi:tRNA(His) guanylyltransferase